MPVANQQVPSPSLAPNRLEGLDAARVLATLGVIWFHCADSDFFHPSGVLGRFSVSFYTVAAMVFLVESARRKQRPFRTYAFDRFRRLYLPFLGWAAISLLLLWTLHSFDDKIEVPNLSLDFLVNGGTIHLWYLPFLLIASLIVYPFVLWMLKSKPRQLAVALIAAALALALDLRLLDFIPTIHIAPIDRFMDDTHLRWSGIYWGITIAILWTNGLKTSAWRVPLAIAGALALITLIIIMWNIGTLERLKIVGGIGLLFVALAPWGKNPIVTALAPFGRLSAGVYFAHMPAITLARFLISSCGGIDSDPLRDATVYLLATSLCIVIIKTFASINGLQWLAGLDTTAPKSPPPKNPLPSPSF